MVIALLTGALGALLAAALVYLLLSRHLADTVAAQRQATVAATAEQVRSEVGERLAHHLDAGNQAFDLRQDSLDHQAEAMGRELATLRQTVVQLQRDKAERDAQILERLDETARRTTGLADTTQALREALASPKARGQWGERMAADVLRLAGLQQGVSYQTQKATAAGTIPDFTFFVGEGRVLHMDVKFPVDNYLRHLEAQTEAEREHFAQQFLRDVRTKIKDLARRDYADKATTVGFLVLFIPNEAVYAFMHEHDPQLLELALGHGVVPCSPSTLFGVLAIVQQAHDNLVLEQTSDEILTCLGDFTTQWEKFCGQVDKVGRSLETAHRAFGDLAGTRRRALQRQVDRVDDLRRRRGLVEVADGSGLALAEVDESGEVHPIRYEAG